MAKNSKPKGKAPARLETQTDISDNAIPELAQALNGLVADSYVLYLKTKNFHWHVSGPHFRDYHLLFDEQAAEIFASTDELAERVRKLGARTVHSLAEMLTLTSIKENEADYVSPGDMLRELMQDNKTVVRNMRAAHEIADKHDDVATASILENFIDQAEKRNWFLFEASRDSDGGGH
ncbi:MAG: DNA starvation/stationary phase protection protein [Alphaproteobacteria bacterium]|nr:DNA starvation/stationary phase protection protein [Alphaproteobacteria bacterium]MBV9418262.1 DNA starvation/stationary phase protection protein [Alphaproteobacteria bacterium]MBV9540958.1 DNA starvation/stationary phase protection protein [Alphaproteobacteria bacterium]MBV9905050.1 DNA starvation/stationary phase protection protein [Alphaproteobacteria bacterium]